MKQLSEKKIEAVKILIEAIKEDYRTWGATRRDEQTDIQKNVRAEMIKEFNEQISYSVGKKYIKIIQRNSVWGFVVNCEDDKLFQDGDVLMASSWAAPARNFPRANIFKEYQVRWAGA